MRTGAFYCKPIGSISSQKSSFVVVLGLHKSFIMKQLRSAFKKGERDREREIEREVGRRWEVGGVWKGKKKKITRTLRKHTVSAYDSHQSSPGRLNGN